MKAWQCSVCRYIHKEDNPPEKCPVCGVDGSRFVQIELDAPPATEARTTGPAAQKTGGSISSTGPAQPPPISKPAGGPAPAKQSPPPPEEKGFDKIKALLLKHHIHPISVHTPNGILPAAVVLFVLAWIFNAGALSTAAAINLVFVVLALPLVIFTGLLEWKKKYQGALTPIFKTKIAAAGVTSLCCIISLAWYGINPGVLSGSMSWLFILVNLIMLGAAGVAGHMGGKLVFKD